MKSKGLTAIVTGLIVMLFIAVSVYAAVNRAPLSGDAENEGEAEARTADAAPFNPDPSAAEKENLGVVANDYLAKLLNDPATLELSPGDNSAVITVSHDELLNEDYYTVKNDRYDVGLSSDLSLRNFTDRTYSYDVPIQPDKKAAEAYITGIFRNLNRGEQYQLTYLEPFSAGLWEAGFPAELDGVYNDYDAIKVFFSPEQEKIAALTVHHTPYEGSGEVAITAEQAKTIVQEKISFSGNAQAQEAVLVFTKPIPFFEQEKEGIDSVPGEAFFAENKVVKAWKVTLLIENTTEYGWDTTVYVFVDCATGDIVGGDGLR